MKYSYMSIQIARQFIVEHAASVNALNIWNQPMTIQYIETPKTIMKVLINYYLLDNQNL